MEILFDGLFEFVVFGCLWCFVKRRMILNELKGRGFLYFRNGLFSFSVDLIYLILFVVG